MNITQSHLRHDSNSCFPISSFTSSTTADNLRGADVEKVGESADDVRKEEKKRLKRIRRIKEEGKDDDDDKKERKK